MSSARLNNQVSEIVSELQKLSEQPVYGPKYSSDSSVYTVQSITNPNIHEIIYCIANIIQTEMFEQLKDIQNNDNSLLTELNILPELPAHLGGTVEAIPSDLLQRETENDPELRQAILSGHVALVDTILRFISWLHQTAKFSAPCNIIAFIYIKRIISTKRLLSMNNWRGLWVGCVMIAQKFWDDTSIRTSSFVAILPGITKSQLKDNELCVFSLLNYTGSVKPSLYAKFFFELRAIFCAITGDFRNHSITSEYRPIRPLNRIQGYALLLREEEDRRLLSPARGASRSGGSGSSTRPTSTSSTTAIDSHSTTSAAATIGTTTTAAAANKLPSIVTLSSQGSTTTTPQLPYTHSHIHNNSSSSSSSTSKYNKSKGELPSNKSKATDTSKLPAIKLPDKSSLRLRKRQQKGRAMTLEDVTAIIARAIFVIN